MTTVAELQAKIDRDIERGYLEESAPGVYHPTALGVTQSRLESLVAIVTAITTAAQRAILLLNDPAPETITYAELAEREGVSQLLGDVSKSTGQYL